MTMRLVAGASLSLSRPAKRWGRPFGRAALLAAVFLGLDAMSAAARADDAARFAAVERKLRALQAELKRFKAEQAAQDHAQRLPPPPSAVAPMMPHIPAGYALVPAAPGATPGTVVLSRAEAPAPTQKGELKIGAVTVQLGGFLAAESAYRSRNMVTDMTSVWNSIPLPNSAAAHESQFLESGRGTRAQAYLTAYPDEETKIEAYLTTDFFGGAPTSNANESNSWVMRLREAWIAYDRADLGLQFLGGQAYGLITMNKQGVSPLLNNQPITIDYAYLPGFTYVRQTQLRVAKSFAGGQYWIAASVENPATLYSGTSVPSSVGSLNTTNTGIGVDATGNTFSTNLAPDVAVKATADYNLMHLEAYGIGRAFTDRVSQIGSGQTNTVIGGGGGAAALVHVVPNILDIQVSGLAGRGIGRYGAGQLPDATIGATGKPVPLPEYQALAGVIGHPVNTVDLYAYVGTEQISARYYDHTSKGKTTAYGYGNPLYSNAGCEIELSTATCTANTSGFVGAATGFWWRFLRGPFGTMQAGAEYSFVHRAIFQGVGPTPKTNENTVMVSFRWYPFQ